MFVRFNAESGPLEAMPARFHVPFPTIEDFRFSILNVATPHAFRSAPPPPPVKEVVMKLQTDQDDYADDF